MGTWGIDGFANDEASDWIADLNPARGYDQMRETLDHVREDVEVSVGQIAVAAAATIALSRGVPYATTPGVLAFLRAVGQPASDEDAHRAATVLSVLLSEPNELRELWLEAPAGAEWPQHIERLIEDLERPPVDQPVLEAEPEGAVPDDVHAGDVYEFALSGGRLFYAQVATKCNKSWLVRVLPGVFERRPGSEDIAALVSQRERFVHIVTGLEQFPLVNRLAPPSAYRHGFPYRIAHGRTSPENPQGWSVVMPDGRYLSGREFAELVPGLDQTMLPPDSVSHPFVLAEMIELGRNPLTGEPNWAPPSPDGAETPQAWAARMASRGRDPLTGDS